VIGVLEGRDLTTLVPEQRRARAGNIRQLARYALRGRFPQNRDFADRYVPYFVDTEGTRCAMAHLIERRGGAEIVERVAARRNNAFVRELLDDRSVVGWLEREGLFADEAALIQPSYCSTPAFDCFCMRETPGVLELSVEVVNGTSFDARVTAVHGEPANMVGDLVSGRANFLPQVGDTLLATDGVHTIYRVDAGRMVDTSTCVTFNIGPPPASAPLDAVIQNLLGDCGAGLDAEWTTQQGCGCSVATTVSAATSSSSKASSSAGGSTSSGGSGGEGGAPLDGVQPGGGGCAASSDRAFGGLLFVPSVLLAAALGLRTRRSR